MVPFATTPRPRSTLITIALLWLLFYASFTLFTPALLDDADSVHSEVAREMLLRHDYVTLYANGIRYLEKAPLLYWSMAGCMKLFMLFGASSPRMLAAAARLPLAFTMLALALVCEAFARRLFQSARAGLYAALILLSSFGMFIFTRITIPDAMVCLWLTVALYAFWRMEDVEESQTPEPSPDRVAHPSRSHREGWGALSDKGTEVGSTEEGTPPFRKQRERMGHPLQWWSFTFAAACALNVLTKGLIGLVFPLGIVLIYLLLTRGLRGTLIRLGQLDLLTSTLVFLLIAAPWHILAGLANPTQGHPTPFQFMHGHWQVPMPTDGNVRGWFWFYFMNEHVLRYLNLRVPRDYDTDPLWLFWGLCLIWMMPWSAFAFHAVKEPVQQWWAAMRVRLTAPKRAQQLYTPRLGGGSFLLVICAVFVLLFFSLSTRQEYYVLPAFPALAILIAGWLTQVQPFTLSSRPESSQSFSEEGVERPLYFARAKSATTLIAVLLIFGSLFAIASFWFLLHARAPAPNTDLAQLLQQNPGDYALSMGHFLDLNAQALGLFRLPLALAALSLFLGPLAGFILRRRSQPHAANLALAAGAFGFLLAAHLGLRTFSPVITSAQLAQAIAPQVQPQDLIVIHGEYEAASTLGFYLQRPASYAPQPNAAQFIHILEGRSSNLWYGSFFPDAPPIFETPQSIAQKWSGPQRIFMWQSTTDEPRNLPPLPGKVYVIAQSGGKEIVSNQPNP